MRKRMLSYTYLDFYPVQQADGTISAPVLFKNIFLEAVAGEPPEKPKLESAATDRLHPIIDALKSLGN